MASRVKSVISSGQELRCPICLDVYTAPKNLPCLHTYCQHCLHKYIVNNVPKGKTGATFSCPECRKETFPPLPHIPVDEWAEHYPYNTVLLCVLPPEKRKVDKSCDSCLYEGNSVRATCFCTVCKEALCPACEKVHKKNKALRDHIVVNIQEIFTDPSLAVNLSVCVTCPDHVGKEFEFYCKSHGSMCCSECFYNSHRHCKEVLKLKDHSERLLKEKEPNTVVDRLKQLRSYLDQFKKENKVSFENIEGDVNSISDEIEELRKKINTLLDNVKAKITMEKTALLKEESIIRHEENQQCESVSSAVTNSLHLLETVLAHGNPLHALTALHKIEEQLVHYESTVKEKHCDVRHVEAKLCIDDRLLSLIKCCEPTIVKLDIVERKTSHARSALPLTKESTINIPGVRANVSQADKKTVDGQKTKQNSLSSKSLNDCKPSQVGQFKGDYPDGNRVRYTGITCLPDDKIMLVDHANSTCRLYDSSHHHLADYTLTSSPRDVCVVEGFQVAVTLPEENKIQLLTVDRSIQSGKKINTSLRCHGIATLSKNQLVVSGNRKEILYWCIVSIDGSEESSVRICSTPFYSCLAVNNSMTRIVVACYQPAVYAYNLDGTLIFRYEHQAIKIASGIALDRENNLYVVCSKSNRIHQVSPNGTTLQVFSTGIPQGPGAICFTSSGDEFLLVNNDDFVHKFKLYSIYHGFTNHIT